MAHRRKIHLLIGLVTAALLAAGLLTAPAQAANGGVFGVVTLDGKVLKGARVTLMRTDADSGDAYKPFKSTMTSSAGVYSFSGADLNDGGIYNRVIVTDPQHHRVVSTERSFTSRPDRTATRNVSMKAAGSIFGKVTRADGSAPTATRVTIDGPDVQFGPGGNEALVYRDNRGVTTTGAYRFYGLPPGTYTIRYDETAKKYLSQCYNDTLAVQGVIPACGSTASKVTVKAGAITRPANQKLSHIGAHLRGRVTNTNGTPLKKLTVTPYTSSAGVTDQGYYRMFKTWTTGGFDLGPLAAGTYKVRVADFSGVWESRWADSVTRADAKVYPLDEGTSTKGLSIKLRSMATLKVNAWPGAGTANFDISLWRRATGGRPSGKVTVSRGAITSTATVQKGVAHVTLTGVPAGMRTFHVTYSGTSSTANATKTVQVRVG